MSQAKMADPIKPIKSESLAVGDKQVAIIDDTKLSSHNLSIKLQFIGEAAAVYKTEEREAFLKAALKGQFIAVLIGELTKSTVEQELATLFEYGIDLPVIVANDDFEEHMIPDTDKSKVIGVHSRPVQYEKLVSGLNMAREMSGLDSNELESAIMSASGSPLFRGLVGSSLAVETLRNTIEKLEEKTTTVLITGESGSGKEIVARNLHYSSGRGSKPFVVVNCAALSSEEFPVKLFGAEASSAGSIHPKLGLLDQANGGTLFLDKVDELPLDIQPKLLSVFENQMFERIGGKEKIKTDIRILASTYHNLSECVTKKTFRQDLFFALNVFPIDVPALRNRAEDIPDLINELVVRLQKQDRPEVSLSPAATLSLQRYNWPGNVRELANLIERLSIIHSNDVVGIEDLPVEYKTVDESDYETLGLSSSDIEIKASKNEEPDDWSSILLSVNFTESLNADSLLGYLDDFAKSIVEVALDDCAGIESLASDRLGISYDELKSLRKSMIA